MSSPLHPPRQARKSKLPFVFLITICCLSGPQLARAAENTRTQEIAAELNIPRRAWTICTVNEVGIAVQAGDIADPTSISDSALAHCSNEEQALRAKAVELLGGAAAARLMQRLEVEARDALIGSARTLLSAKASSNAVDPSWPRVLPPGH